MNFCSFVCIWNCAKLIDFDHFFLFYDFFDVRRQNKNLTMCLYLGNVETLLIEDEQNILSFFFQNGTFVCLLKTTLKPCCEIWKKMFCKNEGIFAKLQFQSVAHEGRKCVINDRSLWLSIRLKSIMTSPLLTSFTKIVHHSIHFTKKIFHFFLPAFSWHYKDVTSIFRHSIHQNKSVLWTWKCGK